MSDWISDGEDGYPVRMKLNSLHDTVLTLTGTTIPISLSNPVVSQVLTYNGSVWINSGVTASSGSTSNINIPQLKLDAGYYTSNDSDVIYTDNLRCYWESADTNFLNYNPEVWIFRRKTYVREPSGSHWKMRHKKWTHEPHLNGVKFPNSKYYSGSINCPFEQIEIDGRHTEFTLTVTGSSEKMEIPLNPYEYIYGKSGSTYISLSGITDFTGIGIKVAGRDSMSLPFRFAIAIDNPDISAINPKIIGELNDIIYLRFGGSGIDIKYFWNEINVKMFGSSRWTH